MFFECLCCKLSSLDGSLISSINSIYSNSIFINPLFQTIFSKQQFYFILKSKSYTLSSVDSSSFLSSVSNNSTLSSVDSSSVLSSVSNNSMISSVDSSSILSIVSNSKSMLSLVDSRSVLSLICNSSTLSSVYR